MIGGLIGHGGRFLWGLALGAGVLILGSKFFNGTRPAKEETVPQDAVGFEAAVVIPSPEPGERVVVNAFPVVPEPGVSEAVLEPIPASEAPPARRSRAAPAATAARVRKGRGSDPRDVSARAKPAPKRAKVEAPAASAPEQAPSRQTTPKRGRAKVVAAPAADAAAAAPKARTRKAAPKASTGEAGDVAKPARRGRKATVEGEGAQ